VNRQQFDAGQQINALNQQSGYARTDLGETMRQLGLRQPVLKQNATNTANSQGLLYSGALGSQIGDLETDYLRERSQAQQGYDREEAGRQSQISGIQGGLNFDRLAAEMTAIERQTQRAADAPLVGGPPPRAVKNGPGRPRVPKAKPKPSPRVQPARRKR
jgi:hypothetical protein